MKIKNKNIETLTNKEFKRKLRLSVIACSNLFLYVFADDRVRFAILTVAVKIVPKLCISGMYIE